MTTTAQIHATAATKAGLATLRDSTPEECGPMAAYFHRPDAHLDTLIDRARLGPAAMMAEGFRRMIRTGDPNQLRTNYSIYLDDRFIGFTSLFRQTAEINHSHWHIIDADMRAAGVSTALYPHRMRMYFDLFPIECLIHQTKTSNIGVNRMLDKFVPVDKTEWIDKPDGLASGGEFNLRFVRRADLPRIMARAKEMGLL
jgi:hypothetical protein